MNLKASLNTFGKTLKSVFRGGEKAAAENAAKAEALGKRAMNIAHPVESRSWVFADKGAQAVSENAAKAAKGEMVVSGPRGLANAARRAPGTAINITDPERGWTYGRQTHRPGPGPIPERGLAVRGDVPPGGNTPKHGKFVYPDKPSGGVGGAGLTPWAKAAGIGAAAGAVVGGTSEWGKGGDFMEGAKTGAVNGAMLGLGYKGAKTFGPKISKSVSAIFNNENGASVAARINHLHNAT